MEMMLPLATAVLLWWSTTGLLLYLVRLPERTHRTSLVAATFTLGIAFACFELSLTRSGAGAAYLGFFSAVLLWGWLEMSYLMGFLTGSEREPCPPELSGWRRFVRAVSVGIYHELAVIAVGVTLIVASAQGSNSVAAWTFGILWFMRWSAKLNLYLGVANLNDDLLPERLRYMVSYMARRPMNGLFPVSVSLGTLLVAYHALAFANAGDPAAATGAALLMSIAALGVLEHWLLVLPVQDSALWRVLTANLATPEQSSVRPATLQQIPLR